MDLIIKLQNPIALLMVLVSLFTIGSAIKQGKPLWDDDLTESDRDMLMRIAAFVIMPIIVFMHESGHALATTWLGGKVSEFHYGFFIGNVVSTGQFTDLQSLIITLAGNVVQVLCGLVALTIALFSTSPPVVALSIYVVFWSIGGTLVAYTILSLFGMYGDWMAIYTSPLTNLVIVIALIHALAVAALIWLAYGEKPRLWFARKTRPHMIAREKELFAQLQENRTIENYLQLGWFYFEMGVEKQARKYCDIVDKSSPTEPGHLLLKGYILQAASKYAPAKNAFLLCAQNQYATVEMRSDAYMAIGNCLVNELETAARGGPVQPELWQPAIESYTQAVAAKPDAATPYFCRATLYAKQGLYNLSEQDFSTVLNSQCLDTNLSELAKAELAHLRQAQAPKQ